MFATVARGDRMHLSTSLPADLLTPLRLRDGARALVVGSGTVELVEAVAASAASVLVVDPDPESAHRTVALRRTLSGVEVRCAPVEVALAADAQAPFDLAVVAAGEPSVLARVAHALPLLSADGVIVVVLDGRGSSATQDRVRMLLADRGWTQQRRLTYVDTPGRPSALIDQAAPEIDDEAGRRAALLVARASGGHGAQAHSTLELVIATASEKAFTEGAREGVAWTTDMPAARAPWRRTRQLGRDGNGWQLSPTAAMDPITSGPLVVRDVISRFPDGASGEDVLAELLTERGPLAAETQRALRAWADAASVAMQDYDVGNLTFDIQPRNFVVDGAVWHFIDNGLAVRFPYPRDMLLLRATLLLLTQRVLRQDVPGIPLQATVREVADLLLRVTGRRATDLLVELWIQFEADLERRTDSAPRSRATATRELRIALETSRLSMLIGPDLARRVETERTRVDAALEHAQATSAELEQERDEIAERLAAAEREAAVRAVGVEQSSRADSGAQRPRRTWRGGAGRVARRLLGQPRLLRATSRLGRLSSNPLFDAAWYLQQYSDVGEKRANPYRHFQRHGWREGRNPNALFDTYWYLETYGDVGASGMNPLDHYLHYGAAEGRDPSPLFDSKWYLATYADVQASGMNPLLHYLRFGHAEGRQVLPTKPADRESSRPVKTMDEPVFGQRGHYYSPLLGPADIARRGNPLAPLLGVTLDDEALWERLEQLGAAARQFAINDGLFAPNPFYGPGDAAVYFAMIRTHQPATIVEVGSGFTTALAIDAIGDRPTRLVAVDPDPSRVKELRLAGHPKLELRAQPVQDVELGLFESLEPGDFLFLDTSHVAKTGSDVMWLLSEVLPRLKAGVLVHIHDIFPGFEYPLSWMEEGRSWNEAYFLRAFLQFNNTFEIFLWPNYATILDPGRAQAIVPQLAENPGAQIWLRVRD